MTAPETMDHRLRRRRERQAAYYGVTAPAERLDRDTLAVWGHLLEPSTLPLHTRAQRRQRITDALAVDGVLTREQLERYFQADAEDLEGLHAAQHTIEPVHMRSTVVSTTFYGMNLSDVLRRPASMGHDVGTAQIRLQLGVPPEQWKAVRAVPDLTDVEPDAVLTTEAGRRIAVEYDRGTYTRPKVIRKLTAFARRYDATLWAVPPPLITLHGRPSLRNRQAALQRMVALAPELARVKSPIHFMVAEWWRDAEVIVS